METLMPPSSPPPPSAPAPGAAGEDKLLIILCHLSALLGVGFILPLIVYLVKKTDAGATAEHAKEVLNFHLSLLVYAVGAFVLIFIAIGILLLLALAVFSLVMAIIAAVKASEGVLYRYPLCIRFIR